MFIWGSPWCSPLSFSGGGWGWWWGLHIFMSNPTTVLRLSCVVLLLGLWQQKPVQFYRAPCITVELPPYSPCIYKSKKFRKCYVRLCKTFWNSSLDARIWYFLQNIKVQHLICLFLNSYNSYKTHIYMNDVMQDKHLCVLVTEKDLILAKQCCIYSGEIQIINIMDNEWKCFLIISVPYSKKLWYVLSQCIFCQALQSKQC